MVTEYITFLEHKGRNPCTVCKREGQLSSLNKHKQIITSLFMLRQLAARPDELNRQPISNRAKLEAGSLQNLWGS